MKNVKRENEIFWSFKIDIGITGDRTKVKVS